VPVNLAQILEWSARLAGCDEVPADSQVYVESPGDVRRVLFGIDIEVGELLYARDAGYDAVIAHHPAGDHARMDFGKVVRRQVGQMAAEGIPAEVAEAAIAERLGPSHRAAHMSNYDRVVGTARLIGLPFCNVHLACDLIGREAIVEMLRRRDGGDRPVGEVLGWFDEFPEMEGALTRPEQWVGEPEAPLGRWTVAMAGGTNGGYPVFREYWRHGVDTIFAMHCAEDDVRRLRAEALPQKNLVVTGHMATDSIGINRVIAGLEAQGIEVTRTSGIVAP
jgi:putative NIF3 family GTP cyclohydrolase 1 type 2